LRNDPINQEWLTISRGWNKDSCVASNIEDLRKNMTAAAGQLTGLKIKPIDNALTELGKTKTTLQNTVNKALADPDGATVNAPDGTLKPGEQPVKVPINGIEIQVAPDVAEAAKKGDQNAIAHAKAVRVQINGQWLWVSPEVADAQVALDLIDRQETSLKARKDNLVAAQNRYEFATARPLTYVVGPREDDNGSEKDYVDHHRDDALDGYQIQLKGFSDKFVPMENDNQLRRTVEQTLGLDTRLPEGQDALNKTVGEIHDVAGDNPEVRVVPMIYVDDKAGAVQTALFEVKVGDHSEYVDVTGKHFDSVGDFQDNNTQFDEDGELVVPKNFDLARNADGKLALDVVKARNVSVWDKTVDVAVGIGTGIATVVAIVPNPLSPFAAGAAYAGGTYFAARSVIKGVSLANHGVDWNDSEMLTNAAMGAASVLPMGAGAMRSFGLVRFATTGMGESMTWGRAFMASNGMVNAESTAGRMASTYIQTGGSVNRMVTAGIPLADATSKSMRFAGQMNKLAHVADAGALGIGAPLMYTQARDLVLHGDEMSGLDFANAIVGLGTGTFGTGMGGRNLLRYVRGPVTAPAAAHARPTAADTQPADRGQEPIIYPDLDALIADQPFKAYPQFEVDGQELAASNPHQFLMRPDLFDQWQAGYVHPLVLRIKGPTNASLERAQQIADLGGVYVYAPRPDGRWQVMVPGEAPHYSGAIAFDPATGKVSLASDDGTVIPIRPEDYLGGLRGSGIDKTAFALLDKTVVVYREDAQYQYDDANHAIAKTRQLEEMGAPHVAKIDGLIQIHGHDALLMDTFPASDQSIEHTIRGGKEHVDVIDASLLTRRSVSSLTEIRNWIVNNNVEITDLQYLIDKDGTFNISDFMEVKTVDRLEPDYIKEIDDYVELIRNSVKNPTKPQSLSANYHDPNSPIEPSGPTIPAAFARPKPSGTGSPDAIPVWSYRAGETSDAAHGGLAYDYLSQSGTALPFGRPESKPRLGSKVQLATTLYPGRGIETFTARGGVEAAANVLHGKKNVLLVTGFNVGMDEAGKPLPETDGPPGTALLGRTLRLLGKNVTYVTDSHNAPVLKASLEALGQPTDKVIVFDAKHRFGARKAADKVLNEVNPDAVMAIELPARNTGGEYLNMRGISVKQQAMEHIVTVGGKTVKVKGSKETVNPPLDEIVIAANLRPGIDTLGVGDGGNEAGMGNVSPLIPPAMNGLDMASSVPVDYLVTSSVSNWGAEAVAGIMLRNARRPDLLHTAGDQHAAIAAAADAGAVDGVTRRQEASVDGFPWEAHAGFHRLLSDAVADGPRDTVYLGIMDSSNGGLFAANTLAEYIRLNTGRTVQRIIGVDHARAPYGKLPPENIANYTNGVLRTLDGALKGTSSHVAIAMACNTACTPGTEVIAAGVDAPVINLIDVTASAMATTGGAKPVSLSTNATRDSNAYANAVTRLTDGQVAIEEIGASDAPFELAQIVNDRMHESTAPADQAFVAAAAKFYAEKIPEDATSVWLTCTHYPALKPQLEAALTARGMGNVEVVDPMRFQAKAVIEHLGLPQTERENVPDTQKARPPVVITSGEPLPEGGTTSYGVRKSAQSFMRREDVRVVHVESFDGVTPAQLNEIRHAIYRPNLPQDGTLHEFSVPIKKDGEIVGWIPMEYFESRQRLDTFKQLDTNKDLTRAYEAVMRLLAQPAGPKPKSLSANYHDPNEPMPENARNRIPPAFRRPDTEPAAAGEREPAKGNTEPAAVEGKGQPAKTETTSGKTTSTADPAVIRFTLPEGFQAGVSWHPSAKGPGPGELPSFLLGEPSSDPSSPNYVIRITPQQIDAFLKGDRSSPKSENTTGGGDSVPKTGNAEEGRGRTLWDTAKAKASHYAPWLGLNATFATVVPPQYLAVANGTAFVLRGLGTAPLAIAPGKFAANSKLGRALRLWNGLTFVANGSYHSSAYASGTGTPFNQLYTVSDNVSLAQNASETRKGKAYAPSKIEKYAGLTALNVANGFLMAEYSIPTGPGAWIPTIVFGSGAIYLTSKAIRTDLAAARASRTGAKSPATPVKGAMGAQAKAPLDLRIANGAVAVGLVGFGLGYLMNMAKADDKKVQLPSGTPTDTATTQPPVDRPTEPPPETKNPPDKKQPPDEKPQPQQFVVTASDGLNLRQKPGAGAAKETLLEPGAFVQETGARTSDGAGRAWIRVEGFGVDGRKHDGWVSANYVEPHPQGASNAEGRLNPALEKRGFHWVQAHDGDSIRAIAVANSKDVARTVILNMDHIVRPDLIFAGDRIYLPA
jgi:glutamate racemase